MKFHRLIKLKSCPHCGYLGFKHTWKAHRYGHIPTYHVECPNCHYCGKSYPLPSLAKIQWNLKRQGD